MYDTSQIFACNPEQKSSVELGRRTRKRSNSSRPGCRGEEITQIPTNQEVIGSKQKQQCFSRVAGKTDARPVAADTTPGCLDALTVEKMTNFFAERRTLTASVVSCVVVLCVSFVSQGECRTEPLSATRKLHFSIIIATKKNKENKLAVLPHYFCRQWLFFLFVTKRVCLVKRLLFHVQRNF